MKRIYDDLTDFILNTTTPATDSDINTLYRFALGNKHELTQAAETAGSFDTFLKMYRTAEKNAAELLQEESTEPIKKISYTVSEYSNGYNDIATADTLNEAQRIANNFAFRFGLSAEDVSIWENIYNDGLLISSDLVGYATQFYKGFNIEYINYKNLWRIAKADKSSETVAYCETLPEALQGIEDNL